MRKPKAAASIYRSREGWRWRVKARNGRKISTSSEGYKRKADLLKSIEQTREALTRFLTAEALFK